MPDEEPTTAAEAADVEEPAAEIDDTVPCPACHQPVRLNLLSDKYAADVPAKFRPRTGRAARGEE